MPMKEQILVPVDGSADTRQAVKWAAEQAIAKNSALHLLHVVKEVAQVPGGIEEYIRSEGIRDAPNAVYLEFVGSHILGAAQDAAQEFGAADVRAEVVTGDPGREIVRYARDNRIALIVMAAQGFGSVCRKVFEDADCTCVLVRRGLLEGLRVLAVDDEPDVLETLVETLPTCVVTKAMTFAAAKELLEKQVFDAAILDIMGVDGYELLKIAKEKGVMAIMLTAHAFSPEDTVASYRRGAALYVSKEKMGEMEVFLNDVLEARRQGKNTWSRWFERFGAYYEKKFGSRWEGRKLGV
jgi:nucleotide-binding universal stress UspA family protein/CheY-like chemotaxis protein